MVMVLQKSLVSSRVQACFMKAGQAGLLMNYNHSLLPHTHHKQGSGFGSRNPESAEGQGMLGEASVWELAVF